MLLWVRGCSGKRYGECQGRDAWNVKWISYERPLRRQHLRKVIKERKDKPLSHLGEERSRQK